jgi:hypothetical protein
MEKRGQPIPSSRFFRDFCVDCGEPMRVTRARLQKFIKNRCEFCDPKHIGVGNAVRSDPENDPDAFKKSWRSE